MTVTLFGIAGSPNVRGAMLGLMEKGVEHSFVEVAPPFKEPDHIARNPFGRVPVLDHDGFLIYETQAILRYLDTAFPGPALRPVDPREAARMDQVLSIVDCYLFETWSAAIGFERLVAEQFFGRACDLERVTQALPLAATCAEALEVLTTGPYLAGQSFSLADIRVMPHFAWLRVTPEGADILADKPRLQKWFDRVQDRASAKAVLV